MEKGNDALISSERQRGSEENTPLNSLLRKFMSWLNEKWANYHGVCLYSLLQDSPMFHSTKSLQATKYTMRCNALNAMNNYEATVNTNNRIFSYEICKSQVNQRQPERA